MALRVCTGTGKWGSMTRHEEVAYDVDECPVCKVIEDRLEANLRLQHSDTIIEELRRDTNIHPVLRDALLGLVSQTVRA